MSLEIGERREYVRMLAERIEADNRAVEALRNEMRGRR